MKNIKLIITAPSIIDLRTRLGFCFCFLITSFYSCNYFNESGGLGVSLNTKEARLRGVFVNQYRPSENPFRINDSLSINVKSAWLEHMWRYAGDNSKKTQIEKNGYQLIVITDKASLNGFNDKWLIGTNYDSTFNETFKNSIITEFKETPLQDTLEWNVQRGSQITGTRAQAIIGKFVLVKSR